jgi:hypothetical protein
MPEQHTLKPTKHEEAQAESSTSTSNEELPAYTPSSSTSDQPPAYESAQAAFNSLLHGDPDETVSVPMISRTVSNSIHNYNPFSRKQGEVKQSVIVRQMKRSQYQAHYAKDAEGKFIGTKSPAPDLGLVFVPSKGSPEEMLRQAEEVALSVQRLRGQGIGKYGQPFDDGRMGGGATGTM